MRHFRQYIVEPKTIVEGGYPNGQHLASYLQGRSDISCALLSQLDLCRTGNSEKDISTLADGARILLTQLLKGTLRRHGSAIRL